MLTRSGSKVTLDQVTGFEEPRNDSCFERNSSSMFLLLRFQTRYPAWTTGFGDNRSLHKYVVELVFWPSRCDV